MNINHSKVVCAKDLANLALELNDAIADGYSIIVSIKMDIDTGWYTAELVDPC